MWPEWLRLATCHREWCLFTKPSTPGHSRLSVGAQWCMGDEWSAKCIFHSVPLCLHSPYTRYTTGNTCNASRRDFWQRGGGNNFRKPAPFLSPALMSAIDLVAGDNSFHRRDMPWWTGAPWTPWLIPGPVLQCFGRLVSILICHGWAAREALTPSSSSQSHSFESLTYLLCEFTVH